VNLVVEAGDAAIQVLRRSRSAETISRAMGRAHSPVVEDRGLMARARKVGAAAETSVREDASHLRHERRAVR
jgi:hypothetical protein